MREDEEELRFTVVIMFATVVNDKNSRTESSRRSYRYSTIRRTSALCHRRNAQTLKRLVGTWIVGILYLRGVREGGCGSVSGVRWDDADALMLWLCYGLSRGWRWRDYAFTKRWTVIGRASGNSDGRCAQRFRGRHAYARWWWRRRHGYGCQKSAAIFFHSCRLLLTV